MHECAARRKLQTVAEVVGVKVSIICSQTDGQSDQLDLAKLSFWQNLEMRPPQCRPARRSGGGMPASIWTAAPSAMC